MLHRARSRWLPPTNEESAFAETFLSCFGRKSGFVGVHLPTGVLPLSKRCSPKPKNPRCSSIGLSSPDFVALDEQRRTQAIAAIADLLRAYVQHKRDETQTATGVDR
jgi:hypothetical protein